MHWEYVALLFVGLAIPASLAVAWSLGQRLERKPSMTRGR